MSEKVRQSQRLGTARVPGTMPLRAIAVFEALIELSCSGCASTIAAGGHFSRRPQPQNGKQRLPLCPSCAPFEQLKI